jgi:hypothetical protein
VEVDVQGFWDHLDHPWLEDMLRVRIDDRALLRLSRPGLKAGRLATAGHGVPPETGPPQGGTGSPVLATASLPSALALWCEQGGQAPCRGEAMLCRSADDWVGAFREQDDAERFARGLPKRLEPCHRQGAPEQTRLRRVSRFPPRLQRRCPLLGVEVFWRPDRPGGPRGTRRTARQQRQAAWRRIMAGIKQPRHVPGRAGFGRLHRRLRGHDNADGLRANLRSVPRFFHGVMDCTCQWRHRRGGKRQRLTWKQGAQVLDRVKRGRPYITEGKRRRVGACRQCFAPRTRVRPRSRMRENGTSGSARGVPGNRHSYRRGELR